MLKYCFCLFFIIILSSQAKEVSCDTTTIAASCLSNFDSNPFKVKQAIQIALDLAAQNIGYQYGSADPANGGMDCSGTMYYLLTQLGIKNVPRSSAGLYQWVTEKGYFYPANVNDINDAAFSYLKPGDLLFWSGTYEAKNNPSATHVMLYLGRDKENNPLMIGSSDGRTYEGRQIYGVSVFDFKLPSKDAKSKFLGYSCIPQFTCRNKS